MTDRSHALWTAVVMLLAGGPSAGCAGGPACSSADLSAALEEASAGDTVEVGACTVEGSFVVPAGVRLRGAGVGRSVLAAREGDTLGVVLENGRGETGLEDVSIDGSVAQVAILARGTGAAVIERLDVTSGELAGVVALVGLTSLRIADTTVDGDRGLEPAASEGEDPVPRDQGGIGVVIANATSVELTNVTVHRNGSGGAWLVESATRWVGGGAPDNGECGVLVEGGTAELEGLDLSGTRASPRGVVAAGALFRGGASGATRGVEAIGGAGLGLVQDGSGEVTHSGPQLRDLQLVGIWAQAAPLRVESADDGLRARIEATGFAGIVAVDTPSIELRRVDVSGTRESTQPIDDGARAGDGLQIVLGDAAATVSLEDVSLVQNDRAGVVLDGPAGVRAPRVSETSVECAPLAWGALRQEPDGPLAWWVGVAPRTTGLCAEIPSMREEVGRAFAAAELPSIDTSVLEAPVAGGER